MLKTDSIKPENKDLIAACLTIAATQIVAANPEGIDENEAINKAIHLFTQLRTTLDPGRILS